MRPSKEKLIRLVHVGFSAELQQHALRCTTPFYWLDPSRPPGSRLLGNGTLFFLKFPEILLGITADHVYQKYLDDRASNSRIECHPPIEPERRVIDRCSDLDLATFRVYTAELGMMGDRIAHEPPREWPPRPPVEGRGVFFAGYPKALREEGEGPEVFWTPYTVGTVAKVVAGDRIIVQLEREYLVVREGDETPPENLWLGGMSGCPLFSLWESPIVFLQLAGVGLEFNENLEIGRFRPIRHIQSDGTISR